MKNKKLFAILTLVCFMMTLMPVAAFAAPNPGDYVMVREASGSYDDHVVVQAGDNVQFVVNVAGTTTASYKYFIVNEDGELVDATLSNGATNVPFNKPGTYKVYAIDDATLVSNLAGATITKAAKLTLLMESAGLYEDYATVKVKDSNVNYRVVLSAIPSTGTTVSRVAGTDNEFNVTILADGGWSGKGSIAATLESTTTANPTSSDYTAAVNSGIWTGGAVKGAELTFTKAGFVNLAVEDAVTDRGGEVEFHVASDRVGSYVMYVKYGNAAKAKLNVTVNSSQVADVAVESAPTAPVDVDAAISNAGVQFKLVDAKGSAYTGLVAADYKIAVVSQPADSDMDKDDFKLNQAVDAMGTPIPGVYDLIGSATPTENKFEEEGTYVIRVTLASGQSAEATVKTATFGDPVAIKFSDRAKTTTLYADAGSTSLLGALGRVVAVDANGVTTNVTPLTKFSATGKSFTAVAGGFAVGNANVNMKDDEDYVGSTITLYAVYEGLTASRTITVTDDASVVKYTNTTGEVGVENVFYGYVLDENGKSVALAGLDTASAAVVLEKPENAVVVTDLVYGAKGLELHVLASVAGEYKVQTVVIDGAGKYVTSIDTFTLGATEGTFEDVIVLSIGSNNMIKNGDVSSLLAAPEIKDGRTMIPMRAGLEAFGATVNWNEANRTVTAEMNGVTVVMTVDSLDYTVNGKAMKADSAPYIKNGSTMVPAVFFTNAFGIVATPLYDANGVCDVLFSK